MPELSETLIDIKDFLLQDRRDPQLTRKKRTSKRETFRKQVNFSFGDQDQVDLISYSGLQEWSSYLQLGEKYIRTLFICGYPYIASTGWLNMLINFNHNIDITYH